MNHVDLHSLNQSAGPQHKVIVYYSQKTAIARVLIFVDEKADQQSLIRLPPKQRHSNTLISNHHPRLDTISLGSLHLQIQESVNDQYVQNWKRLQNVYSAIHWKICSGCSWKRNDVWRLQKLPSINFTHSLFLSFYILFSFCLRCNKEASGQSTSPSDFSILLYSEFAWKKKSLISWFASFARFDSFGSSQLLSWCAQVGKSMFEESQQ